MAVQCRVGACIVAGPTITQGGFPIMPRGIAIRTAAGAVLPRCAAGGRGQTAGERAGGAVLTGLLAIRGGGAPGQHQPPEPRLPGHRGGPRPVKQLRGAVPDRGGVVPPPTEPVPGLRGLVATSPAPISVSRGQVTIISDDISLPGAVIAAFSITVTVARRDVALPGGLVPTVAC